MAVTKVDSTKWTIPGDTPRDDNPDVSQLFKIPGSAPPSPMTGIATTMEPTKDSSRIPTAIGFPHLVLMAARSNLPSSFPDSFFFKTAPFRMSSIHRNLQSLVYRAPSTDSDARCSVLSFPDLTET